MKDVTKEELLEEFQDLEDSDQLPKEIYAHFGLTFYQFDLVEHSLINIATFHFVGEDLVQGRITKKSDWQPAFDKAEAKSISLTMGNLLKVLTAIPEFQNLKDKCAAIKKLRDYFAHHFMREEATLFSSEAGAWFALTKMASVRSFVAEFEEALIEPCNAMCARYGIGTPDEAELKPLVEKFTEERLATLINDTAKMGWES